MARRRYLHCCHLLFNFVYVFLLPRVPYVAKSPIDNHFIWILLATSGRFFSFVICRHATRAAARICQSDADGATRGMLAKIETITAPSSQQQSLGLIVGIFFSWFKKTCAAIFQRSIILTSDRCASRPVCARRRPYILESKLCHRRRHAGANRWAALGGADHRAPVSPARYETWHEKPRCRISTHAKV